MKSIIVSLFGLASLSLVSSCTTVEARNPSVHSKTTTTESTPTTYGSVQTRTTSSY